MSTESWTEHFAAWMARHWFTRWIVMDNHYRCRKCGKRMVHPKISDFSELTQRNIKRKQQEWFLMNTEVYKCTNPNCPSYKSVHITMIP